MQMILNFISRSHSAKTVALLLL